MPAVIEIPPRSNSTFYYHKLLKWLDVILRVPPLFVIDEILKSTGSSSSSEISLEDPDKHMLTCNAILLVIAEFVCSTFGECPCW